MIIIKKKLADIAKWLLYMVIHPILRRFTSFRKHRNILLISNGAQMAEYLADFWDLFKDDQNLNFCLHKFHRDLRPGEADRIMNRLPIRQVGKLEYYFRHWDLVVTADHINSNGTLTHINPYSWPTLRIPHGIANKMVAGQLYTYGKSCYDKRGKILYSCIFASSKTELDLALGMNPAFSDVVTVVSNLKCDLILDQSRQRDDIRYKLGVSPDEKLILVASTFGPNCLFNVIGDALLAEIERLSGQYRFSLTIHPLEYVASLPNKPSWGERLSVFKEKGCLVITPGESWEPYMIASDVIITDHTSLSLFGLVLERPYIFSPIPDTVISEETLTWQLRKFSPVLHADASNLQECLHTALHEYPYTELGSLREKCLPLIGQAKSLVRAAVFRLLKYHKYAG